MPRSRNIKPGIYKNEELVMLPFETRYMAAGLSCWADREGRMEDRPLKLKMEMFPIDDVDINSMLNDLESINYIQRYIVDNIKYIQIVKFSKHQNPHHKELASCIPAPEGHQDSGAVPCEVTPGQRQRILDRDGHKCLECNTKQDLEIDHIVPISKGGTSEDTNLQTLCGRCNSAKGNRHQRAVNEPLTSQEQVKQGAERPTDSFNPVTDSLNPVHTSNHRFDEWWKEYPKKAEKKKALVIWKRRKLGNISDTIIADTINRQSVCQKWKAGFIPNPTTYLNGDRWEDEIETNRGSQNRNGQRETPVQRSERIEREALQDVGFA